MHIHAPGGSTHRCYRGIDILVLGQPHRIRTDNGSPFATTGISGMLSHERIGLLKVEEHLYELYLGDLLGEVDTYWMTFTAVR